MKACFSVFDHKKPKMSGSLGLSKNVHHLKVGAKADGSIDLKKVQGHIKLLGHKYQRCFSAYEANNSKKHPSARVLAASATNEGDVSLTDQQNELWTGTITFGGQDITIDFDTGSSDTLVNQGAYKPGTSAHKTSKTFSTSYGDGTTAKGTVYTDTMTIGGLPEVQDVAIGLATTTFISGEGGSAGISGLAYPALATFGTSYPPFFDSLIKANVLASPVFSFALSTGSSELTLGSVTSKAKGSATYVDVNQSSGFWQAAAATVNGISITAIIDSGTTLIVGSPDQVKQLFKSLDGVETTEESGATYAYLTGSTVPTISFEFAGKTVTLTEDAAVFGTDNQGRKMLSVVGQDIGIEGWVSRTLFPTLLELHSLTIPSVPLQRPTDRRRPPLPLLRHRVRPRQQPPGLLRPKRPLRDWIRDEGSDASDRLGT